MGIVAVNEEMQLLGEINSGKPLSKRYAHRDTPCFRVYVSPFLITVFSSTPILPNLIVDLFAIFTGVDSYNSKPSDFINILFASSRHQLTVHGSERRVEFAELKIDGHTRGLHGGSVTGM